MRALIWRDLAEFAGLWNVEAGTRRGWCNTRRLAELTRAKIEKIGVMSLKSRL